ncbi:hypothetical protein N7G274_001294 [Stereocaulon virgatum]|uniref:Kazal-like domain-containing protein n=1 Tax=Stereocaulon virgatum TaxID=373712 RepID=A0ABR4AP93_9LECA
MAPFPPPPPLRNASLPNPPHTIPQQPPFPSGAQTQWGPDSIGTIFFGILMFFMATIALFQNRQRARQCKHDAEGANCCELDVERIEWLLPVCGERGATYNSSCINNQEPHTADVMENFSTPIAEILRGVGDWSVVDTRVGWQVVSEERDDEDEDEIDLSLVAKMGWDGRSDTDGTLVGDGGDDGKEKEEGVAVENDDDETKQESKRVFIPTHIKARLCFMEAEEKDPKIAQARSAEQYLQDS